MTEEPVSASVNQNCPATWLLLAIVGLYLLGHLLVNSRNGIHRDELPTLDDARQLAWGYVVYPPVTPFVARIALTLSGFP